MSDRIVLMRQGKIIQSGGPEDLFDRPNSRFCADFMGFENIFPVTIQQIDGATVDAGLHEYSIRGTWTGKDAPKTGQSAFAAVRAERMKVGSAEGDTRPWNQIKCQPKVRHYRGKYLDQIADTSFGPVRVRIWDRNMQLQDFQQVSWRDEDCVVFAA